MADSQPNSVTADNGADAASQPPVQPDNNIADKTVTTGSDSKVTEDISKYLNSQGISLDGVSDEIAQSLTKLANNALSAKRASSDEANRRRELEAKLQESNIQPQANQQQVLSNNNISPAVDSSNTSQEPTIDLESDSEVVAMMLTLNLKNNFPDLNDKIEDGSLLKDAKENGVPIYVNKDGKVKLNITGINNYAKQRAERYAMEVELTELRKQAAANAPSVDPLQQLEVNTDGELTLSQAEIIIANPGHKRYDEAVKLYSSHNWKSSPNNQSSKAAF